jgi:two-component system sensor histidine kinase UhpB
VSAVVLVGDGLVLAFSSPITNSPPTASDLLIIGLGLGLMLVLTFALMRLALRPLDRLARDAAEVDLDEPGRRFAEDARAREVRLLQRAFNEMLERLERDQRERALATLRGQEQERQRLSRELHDEIGQDVTAALLVLQGEGEEEVREGVRAILKQTLGSVRRIVAELRPETLDELGLASALENLARRLSRVSDLTVDLSVGPGLPELSPEAELVVYRIAQEGLTNAIRHAGAVRAELNLVRRDDALVLEVLDDGRGVAGARAGNGIRGMRERAFMVSGQLTIDCRPGGGTKLELQLPL